MFELSIETYSCCSTCEEWEKKVNGSRGKIYIVRWGRTYGENRTVEFDYSCTCESFKYGKGKYCKHIESVKKYRCAWNQDFSVGGYHPRCPNCHSPTVVQRVGV